MTKPIERSKKLDNVCYDIRGPIVETAYKLEHEGQKILKLHIGNPAPFGFEAPKELVTDVIRNMPNATGYCESKGLFSARKAVMQYYQQKGVPDVDADNIFIGNGVSELISIAVQALLNDGDEVLLPAPDYPLWTAAVTLTGGKPVHYMCDEESDWYPDTNDMAKKITDRTRAIVIINPNNPTGALYPPSLIEEICKLAREHNLVLLADEIYDKILYDNAKHESVAAIAKDLLTVTFNGLSKNYRAAGFRSGWMVVSGRLDLAKDYLDALNILVSMRLCANVPTQFAIQSALGGYQSIDDLVRPGGRLCEQRNIAYNMLNEIPGLSCVKPKGALYLFAKIDQKRYKVTNDENFVLSLLKRESILVVQGTAFNWPKPDHFRVVFLPYPSELKTCFERIKNFMATAPMEEWC